MRRTSTATILFCLIFFVSPLAIGLYLLGFAIGQFVLGPLSDRVGRLKVLISGSLVFTQASLGAGLTFVL